MSGLKSPVSRPYGAEALPDRPVPGWPSELRVTPSTVINKRRRRPNKHKISELLYCIIDIFNHEIRIPMLAIRCCAAKIRKTHGQSVSRFPQWPEMTLTVGEVHSGLCRCGLVIKVPAAAAYAHTAIALFSVFTATSASLSFIKSLDVRNVEKLHVSRC